MVVYDHLQEEITFGDSLHLLFGIYIAPIGPDVKYLDLQLTSVCRALDRN